MGRMGVRATVAWLAVASVVACGGGGAPASAPSAANAAPVASAGSARSVLAGSTVELDGSASADPEGAPLRYQWSITSRPAGSSVDNASLVGATTANPSFVPDVAGSYVASLVVNDGQIASAASSVNVSAVGPDALGIVIDAAQPVSGTVQFSLTAATAGATVTWYVDLARIGTGASLGWSSLAGANGTHQVLARVAWGAANAVDVKRSFTVSNSSVTIASSVSGVTGRIAVDVRAASPFGITSVSGVFDGVAAGTLGSPNACAGSCAGANDVYRFTVDAAQAGSGSHTMVVTATDGAGSTQQASIAVPISNAPVITLASPADGALVWGTLQVSGGFSTDKPGTVTVVASLGDVTVLSATAQAFAGRYDLGGLAPGSYTLTVKATDATHTVSTLQRTVVVTSSSALVVSPLMSLGPNGQLLAAEGDRILYRAEDQSVRLRDTVAGTELVLQGGTIAYADDWQVSGGRAYVYGQGSDCTTTFVCVYQWDANGVRRNLSAGAPWTSGYQEHPVAKAGYVLWSNGATGYTVFDVASGAYTRLAPAAGINYVGNWAFDLALVDGVLEVFFWGQTGGSGTSSTFDVYQWSAGSGISARLSSPGQRSVYVASDGARVAWSQAPAGALADTTALVAMPVSGGASTVLSSTMGSFQLRDGVLAWAESTGAGRAVKAASANGTRTLSILNSATLYGTAGGRVVYAESGKLYAWNAAQDKVTLVVETGPQQVLVSGSALYFVLGASHSLYRIPMP